MIEKKQEKEKNGNKRQVFST